MFVIVPNDLRDAIYKKIDEQLEITPQFKAEREDIYKDLLHYFDIHGVISDFKLEPKKDSK